MNWSRSTCNTQRATPHFYPHRPRSTRWTPRGYLRSHVVVAIWRVLAFAVVLIVIPAQLRRGHRAPWRAGRGDFALGVSSSKLVQGTCRSPHPRRQLGWLLVLPGAAISLGYLLVLVVGLHSAQRLLTRRNVRRGLDATTGAVLLGFSAKLATEHV